MTETLDIEEYIALATETRKQGKVVEEMGKKIEEDLQARLEILSDEMGYEAAVQEYEAAFEKSAGMAARIFQTGLLSDEEKYDIVRRVSEAAGDDPEVAVKAMREWNERREALATWKDQIMEAIKNGANPDDFDFDLLGDDDDEGSPPPSGNLLI